MKKISTQQIERLLEYLDGTLSPADKQAMERELAESAELNARLDELRSVTQALQQTHLEQPSKNFTQRVMNHLDQYPLRSGLSMRNALFLLAGVMVAVGIGTFLLAAGIFDTPGTIDLNMFAIDNKYIQQTLPSIPFNGKLVVNIIILLNIALAFIVLDRAILRPWFDRRAGFE
jgi:hypothetical protein